MTEYPAGRGYRTRDLAPRLRLAALTAVILGVLLLAAAAFLLSYSGIHHIALQAGVSPRLARLYPVIFDAMLVIASAAVLALRAAGMPTRVYVWLCLIVLLGAVAAGDAVYATGVALPRQATRALVAITPWVLLLLAFGLLLAMLRHLRRARASAREKAQSGSRAIRGHVSLLAPRPGEPPALPPAEHPTHAGQNGAPGTQPQAPGARPQAAAAAVTGDAGSPPAPGDQAGGGEYPPGGGYAAGAGQRGTGYPDTSYPGSSYASAGYSGTGYSGTGYSGTGYSGTGYSGTGYPATGYRGTGHPVTEEYLGTEEYGGSAEYPETDEYHEAAAPPGAPGGGFGAWAGQERHGARPTDAAAQPGAARPGPAGAGAAQPGAARQSGGEQGGGEQGGASPGDEEHDGGQHDAPQASGEAADQAAGDPAAPADPVPAPVPHFDRFRSTPTRPEE